MWNLVFLVKDVEIECVKHETIQIMNNYSLWII